MADSAEGTCELCGRHHVRLTEHHLTPKEAGCLSRPVRTDERLIFSADALSTPAHG
jgi:hypothetical protein